MSRNAFTTIDTPIGPFTMIGRRRSIARHEIAGPAGTFVPTRSAPLADRTTSASCARSYTMSDAES